MFWTQLGIAKYMRRNQNKTRDMLVMGVQSLSSLNHTEARETTAAITHSLSLWATPTRYTQ